MVSLNFIIISLVRGKLKSQNDIILLNVGTNV